MKFWDKREKASGDKGNFYKWCILNPLPSELDLKSSLYRYPGTAAVLDIRTAVQHKYHSEVVTKLFSANKFNK